MLDIIIKQWSDSNDQHGHTQIWCTYSDAVNLTASFMLKQKLMHFGTLASLLARGCGLD